ncbi:hypothetical protein PanWU01x14_258830 [Parasponia andersonii]|uniref:Uncharacterized protein n=1 Tax=Parasponia andersonii TaxID=3476 RepID=A0A2P5B9Q3_PARAD|nr:hypothetical protein PanWU01x14_258830 [Parasponia andersonii]
MASKAITGLGSERTKAKRPVGNVAVDGIATWRWQAEPFGSSAASTQSTYLKAPQPPPTLIHHHLHLPWLYQWHQRWHLSALLRRRHRPIYLQINTTKPSIPRMKK